MKQKLLLGRGRDINGHSPFRLVGGNLYKPAIIILFFSLFFQFLKIVAKHTEHYIYYHNQF